MRAIIRELEKHGYLKRERVPILSGGSTVDYVLTDPRATEMPPSGSDGNAAVRPDQVSDLAAAEETAGQGASAPSDGNAAARSSIEDQEKTKTPSVSRRVAPETRGTRLPEDFIPTPEMLQWFADEQLHLALDVRIEHEKFVNYWVGCPGAKGRKLDWPRTWKNWMWTQAERAPRRPGTALAVSSGASYKPSTTDQRVAQTLSMNAMFEEEDAR